MQQPPVLAMTAVFWLTGNLVCPATVLTGATVDLDVTFIERLPRYAYDAPKNNPEVGETVTFLGHIKCWDGVLPSVAYRWLIDGVAANEGFLTDLAVNEERVVTQEWIWQPGDHWVMLVVDPDGAVGEFSEANNAREDRINAIIAGFWVEQSSYDYFHQYQRELGIGSNSWEDWIQRQMARQNQLYAEAVWPISPQGVLDRVRIDKIVVVPDGALPLAGGLPTNNPDLRDRTVDLMWGFPSSQLPPNSSFYANHTSLSESNPFYIEQSLIHELGHARYLIDSYGFDVHNTAAHGGYDSVQIWEGGTYVGGSRYMPFLAFDEVLHYNQNGGVMSGPYGFRWSPYEAGALNLIAGRRARCGNYNAPCNIGEYLQDLPSNNHVRFTNVGGKPLVGAEISVFRATGGPGWYGKTFDNTPDLLFTTDVDGYVHMPRNPFTDGSLRHTYGLANTVMILRIQHTWKIWYRFVEAADFNMEYWKGNTTDAFYTISLTAPTYDSDLDGLPDDWERYYLSDLSPNAADDQDMDDLTNAQEVQHETDPTDQDTDGDRWTDGYEVNISKTDPTQADTDVDGLADDSDNCPLAFNPGQEDSDGDGAGDACDNTFSAADFDKDGDVDLEDFGHLQACYTVVGQTNLPTACADANLDHDPRSYVDKLDLAIFRGCVSGSGIPADSDCGH